MNYNKMTTLPIPSTLEDGWLQRAQAEIRFPTTIKSSAGKIVKVKDWWDLHTVVHRAMQYYRKNKCAAPWLIR